MVTRIIGFKKPLHKQIDTGLGFFGADPSVVATIFTDLQITTIVEAFIPPGAQRNINHFLMAWHHLKLYPTEIKLEAAFGISPAWDRHWYWYCIKKI